MSNLKHLALFVATAVGATAQAPPPPPPDPVLIMPQLDMPGIGAAVTIASRSILLSNSKPIAGAPYSAQQVTRHEQPLADGNRIVTSTTAKLYRDLQGRTRMENPTTNPMLGPNMALINIVDPVAGFSYMLEPESKTVHKSPLQKAEYKTGGPNRILLTTAAPEITSDKVMAEKSLSDGGPSPDRIFVSKFAGESAASAKISAERTFKPEVKKEDLGTQEVNGVQAKGTRTTETLPAGAVGNEQPLQIVSETWFSPDLSMVVKSVHNDPRFGQTTVSVENIDRQDPDPALFEVPSDYHVMEPKIITRQP